MGSFFSDWFAIVVVFVACDRFAFFEFAVSSRFLLFVGDTGGYCAGGACCAGVVSPQSAAPLG